MARVVTRFTASRGSGPNLDAVAVGSRFAAVFDGATPKSVDPAGAQSAAVRLVEGLVGEVERSKADSVDLLLSALVDVAGDLRDEHEAAAAGALVDLRSHEVVVVSDTWVAIDGQATFFGHEFERHTSAVRRAITLQHLAGGSSVEDLLRTDPGREAVLPLLRWEPSLHNVDAEGEFFFASLNGTPPPPHLLRRIVPSVDAQRLVLASDGYPELHPTFSSSEEALAADVAADPLRIGRHGGTKAVAPGASTFDDRAFLELDLALPVGTD
jgi:hypothetical protein